MKSVLNAFIRSFIVVSSLVGPFAKADADNFNFRGTWYIRNVLKCIVTEFTLRIGAPGTDLELDVRRSTDTSEDMCVRFPREFIEHESMKFRVVSETDTKKNVIALSSTGEPLPNYTYVIEKWYKGELSLLGGRDGKPESSVIFDKL